MTDLPLNPADNPPTEPPMVPTTIPTPAAAAPAASSVQVGPATAQPASSALPPPPSQVQWPPANATIVANMVTRSFGELVAVSGVSFAVQPGVSALLGPNGAGKSTMLRMLSGQIAPTSGEIWVAGGNPRTDQAARGRIGLVPQQDGVFDREMSLAVVKLAAVLSDLDEPEARARWALNLVEMDPDLNRPVGTFSKGMRQRVKIAQALVHDPLVFMMDEPLNGLDPRQRKQMVELFQHLGSIGKTVLISSHVLDEVERFGSHVIVMAKGRLAAQGDFHAIRRLMDNQPLRVRIEATQIQIVGAELIRSGAVLGCTITSHNQANVTTSDIVRFRRVVAKICQQHNSRLSELAPLDDDLESVFRYLTGASQ